VLLMAKTLKLSNLSKKQQELFITAVIHSNYERIKIYLNKFSFTQNELKEICNKYILIYETSLRVVDLFIEKGLMLSHRQYAALIFQGIKNASLYQSKHVLRFSDKANIQILTHFFHNKPHLTFQLIQYFKNNTDILKTKAEYLLTLAILQMNKPLIEEILNEALHININIIKKAGKKQSANNVQTPFYYHKYGALEYFIHEYSQPILHNIKTLHKPAKDETPEKTVMDFIQYLKSLGLVIDKKDTQLLVACSNHPNTEIFDYLEQEIKLKKLNTHNFCIVAESIDLNYLEVAKKMITNQQLKIEKSYHLKLDTKFKLTDFSFLLISSYSPNTQKLYDLIKHDYHHQLKKEVGNMLLNLAQLSNDEPSVALEIIQKHYLKYLKNPEILIKKLATIKEGYEGLVHYELVKKEIETLVALKEKKYLENKIILSKKNVNQNKDKQKI
jgi:hypothetical protein